ncbi:hypothetical protein OSB04_012741 [Centaurea solstitialis]|uniref:Uncharacterized protein n=1 Tax=Centaurea solstitialis TaxID=347529 RepID=A0AA38WE95_9ASTR|nr:hypothetical protein OSB04_012741 [Centaurea solstitialis]
MEFGRKRLKKKEGILDLVSYFRELKPTDWWQREWRSKSQKRHFFLGHAQPTCMAAGTVPLSAVTPPRCAGGMICTAVDEMLLHLARLLNHPVDSATISSSSEWYTLSQYDGSPPSPPASKLFNVKSALVLPVTGGEHM